MEILPLLNAIDIEETTYLAKERVEEGRYRQHFFHILKLRSHLDLVNQLKYRKNEDVSLHCDSAKHFKASVGDFMKC